MKRIFLYIALLIILSCQKENQPPDCVILKPSHKSSFNLGDTISVEIGAVDHDGSIKDVRLSFGGALLTTLNTSPYRYEFSTEGHEPGTYILQAIARDGGDLEETDEIQLTINSVPPRVITSSVDSVTLSSALVRGEVLSDGGLPVLARGICWSTLLNPSLNHRHTIEGSGIGIFESSIDSLLCETQYYVRAYATNGLGTGYSEQSGFTTGSCYSSPTIITSEVSSITDSSAICGGMITDIGGSLITSRGVCWSEFQNPTILDNHTSDTLDESGFVSQIEGLTCGMTYLVRAYVTNKFGTYYGNEVSFTTDQCLIVNLPTVVTINLSNYTNVSAVGGGEVTNDGGGTITARGVCWSTIQNPTISDNITSDGTGTDSFISSLSGLTKSTTYYIRAYATNAAGTSYGEEVILRTYEGIIADYDGNEYWTVIIGDQKWMAENLGTSHYADGSAIPFVENSTSWGALGDTDKAYCWYNNNASNRDTYGGLYTWAAAVNGGASSIANPSGVQGVCPDGWHIPSDIEWKRLELNIGMSQASVDSSDYRGQNAGGKLKETGTTHWIGPNSGATNEYGFTAIPGGLRGWEGSFNNIGKGLNMWSTSLEYSMEYSTDLVWRRQLYYDNTRINREHWHKDQGYSVRCVEGQGYSVPTITTFGASNITDISAESGGNVTADGGQTVTERGVCWSTDPNPTIDNDKTVDGSGTGSFSSSISELNPYATYYIRAYASNSVGTGYGELDSIRTLLSSSYTITDYDGNTYSTIQIGDQIWMQENLNVTHYSDGTAIPNIEGNLEWESLADSSKAFCWFDNNSAFGTTYGALYTWHAAMNGASGSNADPSGIQGVCPNEWHLPSDTEWKELEMNLGMSQIEADKLMERGTNEGGKMKQPGTSHWNDPNTGATNESGFRALPAGERSFSTGEFRPTGISASFWTATWWAIDDPEAWYRSLYSFSSQINRNTIPMKYGFSVRCVKDP